MHRLRKRHSSRPDPNTPPVDAGLLLREQSLQGAAVAGGVAVLLTIALWVALALVFDRYFPWFSVVQGFVVGRAIQRYGRGLHWSYPVLAGALTCVAAFAGSFIVALFLTSREFYTPVLTLVGEISLHTIRVFVLQNFQTVEIIYMLFAATLAAFYSGRRLSREEAVALRRMREQQT
ncbi:MAG: hypothetical protein U5K38_10855 [Woeseiaceae bacterium]|nr:hypothetical protein [Woeseiaceae bacterium]